MISWREKQRMNRNLHYSLGHHHHHHGHGHHGGSSRSPFVKILMIIGVVMVGVFLLYVDLSVSQKFHSSILGGNFPSTTTTGGGTNNNNNEQNPKKYEDPLIRQQRIDKFLQELEEKQQPAVNGGDVSNDEMIVQPDDFIYKGGRYEWDAAPIVIESHKLVFFTIPKVGCTVWKQLFRRMLGYDDWKAQYSQEEDVSPDKWYIPHHPDHNGLKYLYHYDREKANEFMTSNEYTRAIFVRDPKERFLSAFLDKAMSNDGKHLQRQCCNDGECIKPAQESILGFLNLTNICHDGHWNSQTDRLDYKYWKYINFIGHVENSHEDAKKLMNRIQAWDEYGANGWGKHGNESMFQISKSSITGMEHATWSKYKVWQWFTPEIEKIIENHYQLDYDNPLFDFTRTILTEIKDEDNKEQ